MNNACEVQDIINQLVLDLQTQQTALLERFERLSISDIPPAAAPRRAAPPPAVSPRRYHTPQIVTASGYERDKFPAGDRVFVIGNRVRIRNSRGSQQAEGIITKITFSIVEIVLPCSQSRTISVRSFRWFVSRIWCQRSTGVYY
jgi:hypothetical protein